MPVPANAGVELELREPELLELISGVRVFSLRREARIWGLSVRATVDGVFHSEIAATGNPRSRLEFPLARESLGLAFVRKPWQRTLSAVEMCLELADSTLPADDPGG